MAGAFPSSAANLPISSDEKDCLRLSSPLAEHDDDEFQGGNARLKYIPLCDVYSATSPCVTASGSKKVKAAARKLPHINACDQSNLIRMRPLVTHVYSRRKKRKDRNLAVLQSLTSQDLPMESEEFGKVDGEDICLESRVKRRKLDSGKGLNKLGSSWEEPIKLNTALQLQLRDRINPKNTRKNGKLNGVVTSSEDRKLKNGLPENDLENSASAQTKKWLWLSFDGIDPKKFIGLQCKVFWPLDATWYSGCVVSYNSETGRHLVRYVDDEEENLILSNEIIKFQISFEEMRCLKLKCRDKSVDAEGVDVNEMMVLAASLDDSLEIEPGDIIWAKLTGHAVWPAVVLDESHVTARKGLNKISGEKFVLVQFFGTHDFARVTRKQVVSFLKGLLSSCHLKCKKPAFIQGLEEAKMYLSEQKLPKRMLQLRDDIEAHNNDSGSGEHEDGADSGDDESMSHEEIRRKLENLKSCPFETGELQVISIGKIVKNTDNFQSEGLIWPNGYTAVRKFPSTTDPSVLILYKMEVLRDVSSTTRPLFRVTADTGEEFKGSTPSACWNKIYRKIRKAQSNQDDIDEQHSGSYMFGFTHPEVSKLIKEMSSSRPSSKSSQLASLRTKDFPVGFRPVHVEWRDLDKCNVCHMDEEYENNLFLQCDKCRMMVHARCYGELEPTDGILWLCNLCRPDAPKFSPPCCLCPVVGGAMKPTTDGRWAHLACAIWIPETCLADIKKMEPIDGLRRINKDRWKLLCSICGVSYGACIQCSNHTCHVSYHPLCARAAGFCLEPDDVDKLHLVPFDDDEEDQCIQLLSFCRKHRPSTNERLSSDERTDQKACENVDYSPPPNPSGCARTEPYNLLQRRGSNETDFLALASSKRLYVENRPYLVGGCSSSIPLGNMSSNALGGTKYSLDFTKLQATQLDPSDKIFSVADKYNHMRNTFRKRLAFGKSGIHGFGVFTKLPHRAGDMVVEYTGELIRPPVADRREHLIYNSLVGAGTYMFRIDDERVIDATKAGSIAHLINHSCEPNCYSRVISINGDDHIIIFAKRDIKQWEELTYDYRFFSIDEQLACYCGYLRCRGVVNDTEAEERVAKLYAPLTELKDWQGDSTDECYDSKQVGMIALKKEIKYAIPVFVFGAWRILSDRSLKPTRIAPVMHIAPNPSQCRKSSILILLINQVHNYLNFDSLIFFFLGDGTKGWLYENVYPGPKVICQKVPLPQV